MVDALWDCYPENKALQQLRLKLKTCVIELPDGEMKVSVERAILKDFNRAFRPYFDKFIAKDVTLFDIDDEGLPDYALVMKSLWKDMDAETKDTMFEYLNILHRNCVTDLMCSSVPAPLTGVIKNLGKQMQRSSEQPQDLNQLSGVVKDALSDVNMQELCASMMEDADNFTDIFQLAMSTMKAMQQQNAAPH